jgi:hypothetical protein
LDARRWLAGRFFFSGVLTPADVAVLATVEDLCEYPQPASTAAAARAIARLIHIRCSSTTIC